LHGSVRNKGLERVSRPLPLPLRIFMEKFLEFQTIVWKNNLVVDKAGRDLSSNPSRRTDDLWPQPRILCRNASLPTSHMIALNGHKGYRRDCTYPII